MNKSSFLFLKEYFLVKLIHFFLASLILNLSLIYFANFVFWAFFDIFTACECILVKYLYLIFEFFCVNFNKICFNIFFLFSCFFLYKYILIFFWRSSAPLFDDNFCAFSFHFNITFFNIRLWNSSGTFNALLNLLLKALDLIFEKISFIVFNLFCFKVLLNLIKEISSLLFFILSIAYLAPYLIVQILFIKLFNLIFLDNSLWDFILSKILLQNIWIIIALLFKDKFLTVFCHLLKNEYNWLLFIFDFFKIFFFNISLINNWFLAYFLAWKVLKAFCNKMADLFLFLVIFLFWFLHFNKYFFNDNSLVFESLLIKIFFIFSFWLFFKLNVLRLLLNLWRLGLSNDFLILLNLAAININLLTFFFAFPMK